MTAILSQDEIDALLDAISSGSYSEDDLFVHKETTSKRVKIYDWKRPEYLTRTQLDNLSKLHSILGQHIQNFLSEMLSVRVSVDSRNIDSNILSREEFIRSIPNPTFLADIEFKFDVPNKGTGISSIELSPTLVNTIINYLCGGDGSNKLHNIYTSDFELSLLEGIFIRMLGGWREAWSPICDLRPRLYDIHTNPVLSILGYTRDKYEIIILISFEISIEGDSSMINLAIPYESIKLFVRDGYFNSPFFDNYDKDISETKINLEDIKKCFQIGYDPIYMNLSNIEQLKSGDVITFPQSYYEPKLMYKKDSNGNNT